MTTTPETPTAEEATARELVAIAGQIREWQEARGLSNNEMLKRFPGLGSTKTYMRIVSADLGEYNVEKHLASYRATAAAMQEPEVKKEVRIDKLSTVQQVILATLEARQAGGNQRLVLVEGDTACGKTTALQCLADRYPTETIIMEANGTFGNKPMSFLNEIALHLGGGKAHLSESDRLREVVGLLNQRRRILCIDEAHELKPVCLNVLRTLINQTQPSGCVFVLTAMKTLWRKLEQHEAYEEARQLTGNRMRKRVKLHKVAANDMRVLLTELASVPEGEMKKAISMISPHMERNGNLKFVTCVANRARDIAAGDEVTAEHIATAIAQELECR